MWHVCGTVCHALAFLNWGFKEQIMTLILLCIFFLVVGGRQDRFGYLSFQPFMIFCGMLFNVPVFYMGRDGMILMWENPFRGPLEGLGF